VEWRHDKAVGEHVSEAQSVPAQEQCGPECAGDADFGRGLAAEPQREAPRAQEEAEGLCLLGAREDLLPSQHRVRHRRPQGQHSQPEKGERRLHHQD